MVVEVLDEKEKREKRKRKEKESEASRHKDTEERKERRGRLLPVCHRKETTPLYLLLCLIEEFVWREAPQSSGGSKKCSAKSLRHDLMSSEVVSRRCQLTEPEPRCRDPRLVVARGLM